MKVLCRIVVICNAFCMTQWVSANSEDCHSLFSQKSKNEEVQVHVVGSGRDHDLIEQYRIDAEKIFGKGGIADKLGLNLVPHVVEFLASHELTMLVSNGRHATPHWHDGREVAQSMSSFGVMEFVTPGCPICRSFYKDTTRYEHQLSIMMHVAGHNDFSATSSFNLVRNTDQIDESLKLGRLMEKLYHSQGRDEVSDWYQMLLSMVSMQDFARGGFQDPATFKKDPFAPRKIHSDPDVKTNYAHPKAPTSNILQFAIHNLPKDTPQWKIDMIRHFERMVRPYGYIMTTKIMNEGWATLMMDILAGHSQWTDSRFALEYAELLDNVAGKVDLGNPYWLGRETWRNIREEFNARSEIAGLSPLERDRKFVDYAHTLIAQMSDYDFLRYGLNERWVNKYDLYLYREARPEEIVDIPRQSPEDQVQYIVVSRDANDVINFIASRAADRSRTFPQILLEDVDAEDGVMLLRHDVVGGVPLELDSAAQTMFVLTRVFKKPVWLKTIMVEPNRNYTPKTTSIVLKVLRSGEVKIEGYEDSDVMVKMEEDLREAVEIVKLGLNAPQSDADPRSYEDYKRYKTLATEAVVHHQIDHLASQFLSQAPTVRRALREYNRFLQRRALQAIELLKKGQLDYTVTSKSVKFRALPVIPEFKLDARMRKLLEELDDIGMSLHHSERNGASRKNSLALHRDGSFTVATSSNLKLGGSHVDLGSGPHRRGDRFWGPRKDKGNGNGDQDGDQNGNQQPGDDTGNRPGQGDDGIIEIPMKAFGKILNEVLELPNLKPRDGDSSDMDTIREGGVRKPTGELLLDRMAEEAIAVGSVILREKGRKSFAPTEAFYVGMRYLDESDYIVQDRETVPMPDIKAVVVFSRDMSGSMNGRPNELTREFVYHMKALLSHRYENLEFRFVGFSTKGQEFSENDFFVKFLNGGTAYRAGYEKAKEILSEYDPAGWDRFLYTIGDWEDFEAPENTLHLIQDMTEGLSYNGAVHIPSRWNTEPQLWNEMVNLAESVEKLGLAKLRDVPNGTLLTLKELFGKKEE